METVQRTLLKIILLTIMSVWATLIKMVSFKTFCSRIWEKIKHGRISRNKPIYSYINIASKPNHSLGQNHIQGGPVQIFQNNKEIGILEKNFNNKLICVPRQSVDVENDQFQFRNFYSDGVRFFFIFKNRSNFYML